MSNWQPTPLGEVISRSSEIAETQPDESYKEITVKLWGKGVVLRGVVSGSEFNGAPRFVARKGQLVLSRIDARNGAIGIVPESLDGSVVSNDFPLFAIDSKRIVPQYFAWLSKTKRFVELCQRASEGTTNRVRLQEDRFLNLQILLPPVFEQRRIVARIEELATRVKEARNLRQQATHETEAFSGAHAKTLFDGSFECHPVEAIAEVRGGIQKSPDRTPSDNPVRYLTVAHVQRNRIFTNDVRYFEATSEEVDRWRLLSGDVLIIEGNGSAQQIGRTALFRGEIENCVHQNHVIRIRPDSSRVASEFLNSFLNSPAGQDAVRAQSRTTSGLRTLSVGRIKQIQVPVPPISEQRRIVAKLEAFQEQLDVLKKLQAKTATELDALLPSILDKALNREL